MEVCVKEESRWQRAGHSRLARVSSWRDSEAPGLDEFANERAVNLQMRARLR